MLLRRLFFVMLLFCALPAARHAVAQSPAWTGNDDMLLFYEALTKIQEQSIHPEPPKDMVQKAIRGYLRQLDEYSDYLSAEEYAVYNASRDSSYAGVGMDIFGDHYGRILCLPYPGGPAYEAGIRYGDVLTFVGREAVRSNTVRLVGSWIRGLPGETVTVTVTNSKGAVRTLSLVRQRLEADTLELDSHGPCPRIRIYSFGPETVRKLSRLLASLPAGQPRVIDLRGNTGGDFFAAVDAAALFLRAGQPVVDMRTQDGIRQYVAQGQPVDASPLILWQDGLTASAAEVFVAALVDNGRAMSLGATTFGKGVSQTLVALSDGSVMFVTNGALRTPKGDYYHRNGLAPTHVLEVVPGTPDAVFWNATRTMLAKP